LVAGRSLGGLGRPTVGPAAAGAAAPGRWQRGRGGDLEHPRSRPRPRLVTEDAVATARDIWLVPVAGGDARPLLAESFEEWNPRFSPDGGWLAYASDETGQLEIYVRRFPELDHKVQVSEGGGDGPVWTSGGRELAYRSADGHVVVVRFTGGPGRTPVLSRPQALFADVYGAAVGRMSHPDYDAFPDGSRFLMLGNQQDGAFGELNVVLNWFEELRPRGQQPGGRP
jgi:hypothetical protein